MFSIPFRLNVNNGGLSKENTNAIYEHGYVEYLVCQELKCEACTRGTGFKYVIKRIKSFN